MLAGWSSMKARLRPSLSTTRRSTRLSPGWDIPASDKSVADRMVARHREFGADLRLLGAVAHQPAFGAHAQRQAQGIEQYRLAGAGLAGEHAQPRPERQIELVDQHHVADGKAEQHRRR